MSWFGGVGAGVVVVRDATTVFITDPPCQVGEWLRKRHETWVGSVEGKGCGPVSRGDHYAPRPWGNVRERAREYV